MQRCLGDLEKTEGEGRSDEGAEVWALTFPLTLAYVSVGDSEFSV